MRPRVPALLVVVLVALACTACGGGVPRTSNADLLAANQPTPDPTLDAVVRALPNALAGVPPTATPTPHPVLTKPEVRQAPVSPPKASPTPKPSPTPTPRKATATPARH
jgi:hypothetical protein